MAEWIMTSCPDDRVMVTFLPRAERHIAHRMTDSVPVRSIGIGSVDHGHTQRYFLWGKNYVGCFALFYFARDFKPTIN
jgi:hypothetical protein